MKPPEEVRREFVRQWILKADEDLATARHLLASAPTLLGPVGFHAQQAVEKYLNAYLVWRQTEFPKTHNIANLLDLVSSSQEQLAISLDAATVLTKYAVESRYPGDLPEISFEEACEAVELARKSKKIVLTALREAL
jgi:HEPN domain-containing protein